jgi:hypothetical protein
MYFRGKVRRQERRLEAARFSPVRRFCASIVTFPLTAAAALVWSAWNVVWSVHRPAGYALYGLLIAWVFGVAFTLIVMIMIWRARPLI